ncbi:uncharacterized protein C2845_PM13G08860 [Panicum miliaceum]|uniref:Uncharacterized protein n=1 Tax=Panicum miliaceum TaxID=4540 RepID=A0A3L6RLY3_PANMI|nr:uncharacterized protein C2845_PM13G08860 [Panicum miliaceum]
MNDDNLNEISATPTQRGGRRKAREATRGVLLDRMNKAKGTRMRISVLEGNKRPHVPAQAAKFSSVAGVAVRSQVPILTHWKEYKEQLELFNGFVGRLSMSAYLQVPVVHSTLTCKSNLDSNHQGRLAIDTRQQPTIDACSSVFQKSIRQTRYKLKQKYFFGVAANEIRTTSPVSSMTDAQWCQLFDKWSSAHHRHQNKSNNTEPTKVTEDVELQVDDDAEPTEVDALLAFKVCHTSSKNGLSAATIGVVADTIADRQSRLSSAVVVSKALSKASSNSTFLKNAGIADPSSRLRRRSSSEVLLREELDAERQGSSVLHEESGRTLEEQ